MYLKWGDYTHPLGEPQIAITRQPILAESGIPVAHNVTWDIQGKLLGNGQADLDGKIAALKSAYAKQNQDLVLLRSDGQSDSQHTLRSAETRGGTWVVSGPSFPEGGGAQYATMRTFRLQIQAEVPLADPQTALISFEDTLRLSGGGPLFSHIETAFGFPVRQQLRANTTFRAAQSGSAIGYANYPPVPGPLFGYANLIREPVISRTSPQRVGTAHHHYRITWQYEFESALPLSGSPNVATF
ncbi:hypothetical protein DTL42_18270 [Bremerella cremea]|uniref:Uncharacterized protein n=1 Tax=Bremerella cremea TaxID=1031537 RepID=A0A368KMK5_9BACT|nr:hypothetical protein [Bremerella cremea]RCS43932.1 hypothetical protein DTL42_18270 [Bremerella cremea]